MCVLRDTNSSSMLLKVLNSKLHFLSNKLSGMFLDSTLKN